MSIASAVSTISFRALRVANRLRLRVFKNSKGEPAHAKPDGSDWTPAQWLQAVIGELGEYAQVRIDYEAGLLSADQYREKAAKELADVQIYLDILAQRCLDVTPSGSLSLANELQRLAAHLGAFANLRKKLDRGDYNFEDYLTLASPILFGGLKPSAEAITRMAVTRAYQGAPLPVSEAHPNGINLGEATRLKFNEVSARISVDIAIDERGQVTVAEQSAPDA